MVGFGAVSRKSDEATRTIPPTPSSLKAPRFQARRSDSNLQNSDIALLPRFNPELVPLILLNFQRALKQSGLPANELQADRVSEMRYFRLSCGYKPKLHHRA